MKRSNEPVPIETDLTLIDRAFEDLQPTKELGDWFGNYFRGHRERLAIDLRMLRDCASAGDTDTVVEFGSTPCLLTHAAAAAGFRVIGVDLAPGRVTAASGPLAIVKCDIERELVPLEDATADIVLFNELFEHLRIDPIFTLGEVARVIKPGGRLLLSTPNMRSLAGIHSLLLNNRSAFLCPMPYNEYEKLRKLGHMGHVREYTTRDVIDFLRHFDFTTDEIIHRGISPRHRWLQRRIPRLKPMFTIVARKNR